MESDLLEGYTESEKQQLLFRLNGSVSKDDVKSKLSTYTGVPATSIDDNYAQKLYDLLKKNGSTGMAGVGIASAPALTQATTDQGGGGGGILSQFFKPVADVGVDYAQNGSSGKLFGKGGDLGGGWTAALGGALNGYNQGRRNYEEDPNMSNQKDGFGTKHKDYRAELGGGVLGGVMGYFGGPIGAAAAGPAVKGAHSFMEPATRKVVNFGDKWGGATGAMMMDPAAAVSSGKYSWGEIFQVPFTKKLFNW